MGIGEIILLIIVGAIVGALGRLINPGRDPMGLIATIAIGVASMLVAAWLLDNTLLQWIVGIIVAVVLVSVYARLVGPRVTTGRAAVNRY